MQYDESLSCGSLGEEAIAPGLLLGQVEDGLVDARAHDLDVAGGHDERVRELERPFAEEDRVALARLGEGVLQLVLRRAARKSGARARRARRSHGRARAARAA
jgi:hypothetical protein